VNLVAMDLEARPRFFEALGAKLLDLRARTGRPHFIVLDEAHHLMPRSQAAAGTLWDRADLSGFVLVTVHPEHVAVRSLARVTDALVVGQTPLATLRELAAAVGAPPPPGDVDPPLPPGE